MRLRIKSEKIAIGKKPILYSNKILIFKFNYTWCYLLFLMFLLIIRLICYNILLYNNFLSFLFRFFRFGPF